MHISTKRLTTIFHQHVISETYTNMKELYENASAKPRNNNYQITLAYFNKDNLQML